MRIVEVIPQLHLGGAEHFTVDFCNETVRRGHEVFLIVTNPVSKYGYFAKFLDSRVNLISMDKRAGADPLLFFRLCRLIRTLKPDVVHTHLGAIVYNLLTPIFCRKPRYFHTIHNAAEKEATTGGWFTAMVRKFMFRFNMAVPVTISNESKKSFHVFYGNKAKAEMICNGCPKVAVKPENAPEIASLRYQTTNILVNVARVMPQKNQMPLVKAVETLGNGNHGLQLLIIGDNEGEIADKIRSLSLKYSVMVGPRSNPRDYMAAADAFVLSSVYEGMPLTLIECFSVGTIPICTPVGGIRDMIIDGVNGILAKGTSEQDLKDAIMRFLSMDDESRQKMKEASAQTFPKYSMETCVDNYIRLFNGQ